MRNRRKTVADLRALKGRRQLTKLYLDTLEEAPAAAAAGIDMLSIILQETASPQNDREGPSESRSAP